MTRNPLPRHTLEEALQVAKTIQEKNGGNPWKPIFLAQSLDIKPTSSNFRDITSSSYKYGLTSGTWNASHISLTTLGETITKPPSLKVELKSKQEAVLKIDVFEKIYEHYRDSKFPSAEDKYFKNMLETEFNVPRKFVEMCINQLIENGKFSEILSEVKGDLFVVFAEEPLTNHPEESKEEVLEDKKQTDVKSSIEDEEIPCEPKIANQIFVAHGKNRTPLKQMKSILTEFNVPYKVAIDEPHVGRPISKKVADLMKACTSAIIIFTADEEYVDADGNKIYRPSDNVVYELGASSVLYGNKIVILKEEGVTLASDFSDLGYITFEKDKIKAKAMDVIKELIGFGLLKVTPA